MKLHHSNWQLLALVWSLLAVTLGGCAVSGTPASGNGSIRGVTATATTPPRSQPPSATWQANTSSPDSTTSFAFEPGSPGTGYLCTGGSTQQTKGPRLYKTSDGGQNWKVVTTEPLPDLPCRVFIDASAPSDLFLQQVLEPSANFGDPVKKALWRSQDGGMTWKQLPLPNQGWWVNLVTVGTRLVAQGPFTSTSGGGESPCNPAIHPSPATDVYVSDDGGLTWRPIGQSIEQQHLVVDGVVALGTSIFAQADSLPRNECDTTPTISSLWKSNDGGTTWTKVSMPACTLMSLSFTAQTGGGDFAGVALATGLDRSHPTTFGVLYSDDSGATWSVLPAFTPPHGTPAAADTGNPPNLAISPSGAVIAEFTVLDSGTSDAAIYLLRPQGTAPTWMRYAPGSIGQNVAQWQVVHSGQGDQLWGLGYTLSGSPLAYLPLP
jgi:photosystem II stability/assembly factor-like uncharacterized protein